MKKFYTTILLTLLGYLATQAQPCDPCPRMLSLNDANGCVNLDLFSIFGTLGQAYYGNEDSMLIKACKNSITSLSVAALPYSVQGNTCTYGTISIDSISTSGGTTLSYINNQFVVQWGSFSSGSIYISFSIAGGGAPSAPCKNSIILKFALIDAPIANFIPSPQPACFSNPTPISFNANSSVGATNYFWNFGDGFTSTSMNPTHNYSAPGTYNVCLYVNNKSGTGGSAMGFPTDCIGCLDTFCSTVTIDPLPPPDITCIATICNGTTKKYCTSAPSCSAYNWSVLGGTIASGLGTNCITVNWGSGVPQGFLSLNVVGCATPFCTNSNVITVPIIPSTGIITGTSLACVSSSYSYSLPSFPGTSYAWVVSAGGNITSANTNTNTILINWVSSGTHTITANYSNAELGCSGVATYIVTVAPNLNILGPTDICELGISSYSASLDNPLAYPNCTWTISPSATILLGQSTSYATIQWPASGVYTITATTIGAPSACGTAQFVVAVAPLPIVTDIVGPQNICINGTNNYYATSTINSGFYTWSITGGSYTPSGAAQDSIAVTWANAGPYSIDVVQILLNGCTSGNYSESYTAGIIPAIVGNTSVCADDTTTYIITNLPTGNFNWYITPSQYGTVYTGQGTNTAQIIWSGNNNPGATNSVWLHYGICNADSVAINITDPAPVSITATGSLCSGTGVNLSTGIGSGTYAWTSTNTILPTQSITLNSLSSLNQPALYSIAVNNINNTGCNVSGTINIADVGRPVAQISASNVLIYCTSNLPNMTLNALTGIGYSYQWYLNNTLVGTGSTLAVNSAAPCNINAAGVYIFYEITTLNNCIDTSNIIVVQVFSCSGSGPNTGGTCPGVAVTINSIAGCNPFIVNATATGPIGATQIPGSQTITHYDDNSVVSGTITNTFTTAGYQTIKVCKNVLLVDNITICTGCKDTSVLISVAADFVANHVCGVVTFINNSTAFAPVTIAGYAWSVTDGAGNPLPPIIANYNNASIASPTLTIKQSGIYIITLTTNGSNGCAATYKDTITVSLPNANFIINTSCVGTPVNFVNIATTTTNYWNFGDATSSYVSPTQHTNASSSIYNVLHAVSDANGCTDTIINSLTILPKPICLISVTGSNPFCTNDSLILAGCPIYTNYQWYKNGVAISGAITTSLIVHSAGYYYFTANSIIGCNVQSDTITASTLQAPNANITQTNLGCVGNTVTFGVPSCFACNFVWTLDNVVAPSGSNIVSAVAGGIALPIGTHTITVAVTDFGTGCTSVDTTTITIYPTPTITTNVYGLPNPLFCSNNLYTFEAISNATNPSWVWTYAGQNISTNDSLQTASDGFYQVVVTDGITGCKATSVKVINASPNVSLFPIGCDSLCDTSTAFILAPIPSVNNFLGGYTINWYDNAPPFGTPIFTGISIPVSALAVGTHLLSIIATSPNGCTDTSIVYDLYIKSCVPAPLAILPLYLAGTTIHQTAMLQWQSFGYDATNRYEIQTSNDGIIFTTKYIMAKENIAQNQLMNKLKDDLKDNAPMYYRIMQVFNNQSYKYSNIIKLQSNDVLQESIVAIPTVVSNNIEILMNMIETVNTNIIISNAIGVELMHIPVALQKGNNTSSINLQQFSNGLYYISMATKYGVQQVKVIKQ